MCDQHGFFDLDERYEALKRGRPKKRPDNRQKNNKSVSGGTNPLFFKVSGYVQ